MDDINIGEILRIYMDKKDITQRDLAEKVGITRKSLSNYLNNTAVPDIFTLAKLCEFLEIDIYMALGLHPFQNHDDLFIRDNYEYQVIKYYRSLPNQYSKTKFIKIIKFIKDELS